ncbi:hypothetical protein GM50_7275 [freshwater metagenome]|uniref:Helicase XPB/Ssl2 N-terminal domain-containing protein n=1 Tax=freshwater metagenome TaxID=449393 RepID=A0A094Q6G3_9ZZZZ
MEIRSFADYLRGLDDAALLRLFTHRADLISPVPPDMASLAVRASSAPSLARAIDALNAWQFQVLEACAVASEPFTEKIVAALTDKPAIFVIPGLIERGLIYPADDGLRMPTTLRELLGNEVAQLGPHSMAKLNLKKLTDAPPSAKKILEAMAWGPPRGTVTDIKKPGAGVQWCLEEGFLIPYSQTIVVMPREVAIALRGGKVHKEQRVNSPEASYAFTTKDRKNINSAAIANVTTFLRWVEEVLNFWAQDPPTALRSGGLGVRDLKALALHIGVDESCAAFVAELCYISALLTIDPDDRILPTTNFDIWLTQRPSDKWLTLTSAWLSTSRVSGLVGNEDSKNVAPLGPELDRVNAASVRSLVLSLLRDHREGAITPDSMVAIASWHRPSKRIGGIHPSHILFTLRESEWLGVTGQGVISDYGLALIEQSSLEQIDNDLPEDVDHILIQSDNTAIAPGPLAQEVAQEMALLADVESRGGATVFRFTDSTIRRALDHGKTGDEITKFLKATSKTPMPQPLEYLIADVAKKHGKLRVGSTTSFIRCEDQSVIVAILSDKKLDGMGFRKIAAEVLISDLEVDDAVNVLRNAGYLPAVEDSKGILLSGARIMRSQSKARPPRIVGEIDTPTEIVLEGAVRVLRTGEKSSHRQSTLRNISSSALGELPRTTANETLELLSHHLTHSADKSLSIGYADNNGLISHRIIDPLKLSAGTLLARDHATGEITTFRIARITGVASL